MSDFLGVAALVAERGRFVETVAGLTDDEFDRGSTLCSRWAPRDVLAHLMTTGDLRPYLRNGLRINRANSELVASLRDLDRVDLLTRARRWVDHPSPVDRLGARMLLGDVSVHHQDVLRGLGRSRTLPDGIAAAILREGAILSSFSGHRLWRFRVEPTDGHRALGRGRVVRGPAEALGLWLAGRRGLEPELQFAA